MMQIQGYYREKAKRNEALSDKNSIPKKQQSLFNSI